MIYSLTAHYLIFIGHSYCQYVRNAYLGSSDMPLYPLPCTLVNDMCAIGLISLVKYFLMFPSPIRQRILKRCCHDLYGIRI